MVIARHARALLMVAPLLAASIQVASASQTVVGGAQPAIVKINVGHAPSFQAKKPAPYPHCGVQFSYTLSPNQTALFFTFGWPSQIATEWSVMDDTYDPGQANVWLENVATEGDETQSGSNVTYWLTITNLRPFNELIEGRYCELQKTIL